MAACQYCDGSAQSRRCGCDRRQICAVPAKTTGDRRNLRCGDDAGCRRSAVQGLLTVFSLLYLLAGRKGVDCSLRGQFGARPCLPLGRCSLRPGRAAGGGRRRDVRAERHGLPPAPLDTRVVADAIHDSRPRRATSCRPSTSRGACSALTGAWRRMCGQRTASTTARSRPRPSNGAASTVGLPRPTAPRGCGSGARRPGRRARQRSRSTRVT